MRLRYLFVFGLLFVASLNVCASVEITEIMYDHEGSDSKKEWVEVYNNSDSAIDFLLYKLREADTNHALKTYNGSGVIPAKGYAIIADSPDDVVSELSNAIIFDSSFSLSNSGEELSIIDPGGGVSDSVVYDVLIGAKGDGNTLQKVDGVWVSASPTPGSGSQTNVSDISSDADAEINPTDSDSQKAERSSGGGKEKPKYFYLEATVPKYIFVGEHVMFEARTFDEDDNELLYSQYTWSFGDGSSSQEPSPIHVYENVGDYIVYTEARSGSQIEFSKQRIHVYEKPFAISSVDEGIVTIKNISSKELDIGGWSIMSKGFFYVFPKHTYVIAKGVLSVSRGVTGFGFYADTVLVSPSGDVVRVDIVKEERVQKAQVSPALAPRVSVDANNGPDQSTEHALQASVAASGASSSTWTWISIFGGVLALGLVLLYFLLKKHNLIDEIEIIE